MANENSSLNKYFFGLVAFMMAVMVVPFRSIARTLTCLVPVLASTDPRDFASEAFFTKDFAFATAALCLVEFPDRNAVGVALEIVFIVVSSIGSDSVVLPPPKPPQTAEVRGISTN